MPPLKFTNKGRLLQLKALDGAELRFTRIALGDGALKSQAPATLTALIHETVSVEIVKTRRSAEAVTLRGMLDLTGVTPFYWRELGVCALDPEEGEILYGYANAFDQGEYIDPDAQVLERVLAVNALVGDAANVSAVIDESLLYATLDPATGWVREEQLPPSQREVLSVQWGGTGASTAEEARANLGACAEFPPVTITVPAASWAGTGPWTQTVAVEGITAAMTGVGLYMVDVSDAAARKLYEAAYGCLAAEFETLDGGVKLTCRDKKPTTNFQAQLRGVKP